MKKSAIIWIFIIGALIVIGLFVVSVLNNPFTNRVTDDFLKYFNLIVTPLGIVVGLIIGYPLLKRKLLENYVSKQFDVMHETNRVLRKECVFLMTKYQLEAISKELEKSHINEAVNDMDKLSNIAIDANPAAHKYSILMLNALKEFVKIYPDEGSRLCYKEGFVIFRKLK